MRFGRLLGTLESAPLIAVLLCVAPPAHANTVYVANNGTDSTFCGFFVINGVNCGAKEVPCRSISCAVREAGAGDTILVGRGRYGDLNRDGVLNDEGDEFGSSGCNCVVSVNKPLIIVSSDGAASTVIDARTVDIGKNVLLTFDGGEFGRPGKGFTVTNTAGDLAHGIEIAATNVKVRGNQVVGALDPFATEFVRPNVAIRAALDGRVLIEGNQVLGSWEYGIFAGYVTGKTVRKNHVSTLGFYGIYAAGDGAVLGNVVTGDSRGIGLEGGAKVVGNAVSASFVGLIVHGSSPFTGVIERNNLVGNGDGNCGLYNDGVALLTATNNYWGAASGPGAEPADGVCQNGGFTTTTPFATTPFNVSAPIKP